MIDKLNEVKKKCLVLDIETSGQYPEGDLIDIATNFEDYVKFAKVKWLGMYSYLLDEYVEINVVDCDPEIIKAYIAQHDVIIGFNNEEFDIPIMYNNNLMPEDKYYLQVDCLVTLGSSTYLRHDGLPFKNRGALMGYKFKKNSLKHMAEVMGLETQKGDIDYMIFLRNSWTDEEIAEIKKYLRADVQATKEMFEKMWNYWLPFAMFIDEKNVLKLSWIRASIASLTYQAACNIMGIEPTYADRPEKAKEEMGGRVIQPKYEEAVNVWYLDFASLYPHIFSMFNLFAEITDSSDSNLWHGNKLFQVKGYYDIAQRHPLAVDVANKLVERIRLKREDPENPMIYTLKIFLNGLYGAVRSPIFEKIHTENAGWDCCWLGQQIQEYTENRMKEFGFETIAGDTDSIFVILRGQMRDDGTERDYVKHCLNTIVQEIKDNVPFPAETFNIDIENFLDYVKWPFSEQPVQDEFGNNIKNEKGRLIKEFKAKKKNYLYIYKDKEGNKKLKIVGLPIIKDNATVLGPKILQQTLKPIILERVNASFTKKEMNEILEKWLAKPESIKDLSREFKVKPNSSYKLDKKGNESNNIYPQISRGYFNGQGGVISLIKNKKVGRVGKTMKYATYEEVVAARLEMKDFDLTKLLNELSAFIKN